MKNKTLLFSPFLQANTFRCTCWAKTGSWRFVKFKFSEEELNWGAKCHNDTCPRMKVRERNFHQNVKKLSWFGAAMLNKWPGGYNCQLSTANCLAQSPLVNLPVLVYQFSRLYKCKIMSGYVDCFENNYLHYSCCCERWDMHWRGRRLSFAKSRW